MRAPDFPQKNVAAMRIPFNKPYPTGKELAYINEAMAGGHLSGDGLFSSRCQYWLKETLGCPTALLVPSCTAALEMAAILCELEAGDEVIMPAFTFSSTANAVVLRGAVPVFVDVRSDTLNLDETLIEAAITPRTKAIFVVHYAGVACEMDRIHELAERHRLAVVEDAAHGILGRYNGRYLGTIGDIGALSFHETKNVIAGEARSSSTATVIASEPKSSARKGRIAPSFPAAKSTSTLGSMSDRPTCRAKSSPPICLHSWNRRTS
jgi:dTDP-4-amino-4,6-dideoxygalactose transaminase